MGLLITDQQSDQAARLCGLRGTLAATSGFFNATVNFNAAPIPEPETYAMMLAGLGLTGFVARRRRQ